jgi:hypothetical protein
MAVFGRFNIRFVVAGAGLCMIAIPLSPEVAAAPPGGGNGCFEGKGEVCTSSAPLADMAGVPMALPGPIPAAPAVPVVPAAPPVPVVPAAPPVPVVPAAGAPAAAPLAAGAPLTDMAGLGGKGAPTGPPPAGAPVSGQPLLPGPSAAGAS